MSLTLPMDETNLLQEGKRPKWGNKMEYLLNAIGFSVGLGNVWRFPFLCYKHGGGAFLVPFLILLVVVGLPLFFFEMVLGQFPALDTIYAWNCIPLYRGIGWSFLIINSLVSIYYNAIISLAIHYMLSSFNPTLPWGSCNNAWNDAKCLAFNYSKGESPALQYFERQVLGIRSYSGALRSFEPNLGPVQYQFALCLMLAWVLIFLCIFKGLKGVGKVVYLTATSPYVVLFIFVIYGATLPGAAEGIKYYTLPQFEQLTKIEAWRAAASQVFFALGLGYGTLTSMSSFNKFNNNAHRDALVLAFINALTSIFAGFAVFSFLGHMAYQANVPVDSVAVAGPGLAFVVYPHGLSKMPWSNLWCFLFFFMLLMLGMDSEFSLVETFKVVITYQFPSYFRKEKRVIIMTGAICGVLFLLGLPLTCQSGFFLLDVIDSYLNYPAVFVCTFEIIVISQIYGIERIVKDTELMLGFKLHFYWKYSWYITTPLTLLILLFLSCYYASALTYGKEYVYPDWSVAFGWLLAIVCVLPVFINAGYMFATNGLSLKVIQPAADWGPSEEKFWLEDEYYRKKLEDNNEKIETKLTKRKQNPI